MCNKTKFAMQLKKLVHHESNILRKETKIARDLSKYKDSLSKLMLQILKQSEQLKVFQRELHKLKDINDKLRKFLDDEELRLQQVEENVEDLRQQVFQKRQEQIQEKHRLRCFKSCTQIFMNANVIVCEKQTTSQLVPFKIPQQHVQQEVMDNLLQTCEQSGSFNEHWQDLLIGCSDEVILNDSLK